MHNLLLVLACTTALGLAPLSARADEASHRKTTMELFQQMDMAKVLNTSMEASLKVQVQSGEEGKRPVMVVAQQLASGEVIQTIEGPASDVSQLLARRSLAEIDTLASGATVGASAGDHSMAIPLGGDRMLAITGAIPADSLRAMIRRLNAELRSK